MNNKKIVTSTSIGLVAIIAAVFAISALSPIYIDDARLTTTDLRTTDIVETKHYEGGLLPPDDPIFFYIPVNGIADDRSSLHKNYSYLLNIFDGYDEMMVFEFEAKDMEGVFFTDNTILLSKNPITDQTGWQEFIYDQEGIRIDIGPKGTWNSDKMFEHIDQGSIRHDIGLYIIGELRPMALDVPHDEGNELAGTYNVPAEYGFLNDKDSASIRGFLTTEQVEILALALSPRL